MIIKDKFNLLLKSDFIRNVSETFATRIFLLLIGLITSAIITRMLEPKGRGLVAAATTVTAIGVQFGNLGLHSSNTYYVANNPKILGTLIGNSLLISFGAVGVIICLLYGIFITWTEISPVQDSLLILALISIPISLAYMLLQNLLLGIHESNKYNQIERITGLLSILLLSLLILFHQVSPSRVYIISLIIPAIGTLFILKNLKNHITTSLKPSIELIKKHFFYGVKAYIACFFSYMVLRFDVLMIQYMQGPEALGIYSVSVGLIDKISIIPGAIGTILFPKLSALNSSNEKLNFLFKILVPIAFILTAIAILAGFISPTLIRILYGSSFSESLLPLLILLPAFIFLSLNGILMNYLASIEMPSITILSPLLATVTNIMLNFYLIPIYGVSGAATSSLISYFLMFSLTLIYILPKKIINT